MNKIFFIISRGRSGSDLLVQMLNQHDQIAVAPEALFILSLFQKHGKSQAWNKEKIIKFCNDLFLESRLVDWRCLNKIEVQDYLIDNLKKYNSFQEICLEVYKCYALKEKKKNFLWLGDKNPTHALYVKRLLQLFPDAKFIYLVRDYRDNILSFKKVSFDLNSISALASRWSYYNKEVLRWYDQQPDKFKMIRYEDLLSNPEQILGEVCSFLGIQYSGDMMKFRASDSILKEWQKGLAKPVDESKIEGWRRNMSQLDINKADFICGKVAKKLGYRTEYPKASLLMLLRTFTGRTLGNVINWMEAAFFFLPLRFRCSILEIYRILTRTKSKVN